MDSIKRSFFLIFSFVLFFNTASAQSKDWEWIKTFGGKNADGIYGSCLDKSENLYIAGYFQGEINIDGKQLKSKGDTDALIAKFDKNGNLCWAKQIGGEYAENLIITEYTKDIKIDPSGNIVVAGVHSWGATIDKTSLGGPGNTDIFIAKYTDGGDLIWVKSFGSFSHDYLFDMDLDDQNNIYFTGLFNGSIFSGEERVQETGDIAGSTTCLIKLDLSGNLSWLRADQGVADNAFISTDKNGLIYYGINFSSGITIDGIFIEHVGNGDFLVQKINTKGETIWQKKYNSKFSDLLSSLSIANDNTLLISGKYANISEFNLKSSNDSIGDSRTYFSKINSEGSLSWSANNSGPSFPNGTLLTSSMGDSYLSTDVFSKELNLEGKVLTPIGNWFNSYLAIHDHNGEIQEPVIQISGIIKSVLQQTPNSIVVTGDCANKIGFFQHFNPSGGFIDIYLGKLKLPHSDASSVDPYISAIQDGYTIFPNPTISKTLTLDSKSTKIVDRINITDKDGKLLQYKDNCNLPYRLDLYYLTSGSYFISIIQDKYITTKQIIVN